MEKEIIIINGTGGSGIHTLLIKREGLDNINSNYSDSVVDDYNYDFYIKNTTLEELNYQAKEFTQHLTKTIQHRKK